MRRPCLGFSLIELMVALTLSSLALVAALSLHARSSADWRVLAGHVRLHEQLGWAAEVLRADALLAGYWGEALRPELIQIPEDLLIRCRLSGADASGWALQLGRAVEVGDNAWAAPCPLLQPRAGSDLLVLRHAGADQVTPDAGQVQLVASLPRGQLFANGERPVGFGATASVHDLVINAWYVSDTSSFDPDQPSLRVLSLVKPGRLEDQEVATGIENMQVQLGIDTSGDGRVDRYLDAGDPLVASGGVRALRFWLLARSERAEPGFHDFQAWQPPDAALAPIQPGVTPGYPAGHRRMAIAQTVRLRNMALGD